MGGGREAGYEAVIKAVVANGGWERAGGLLRLRYYNEENGPDRVNKYSQSQVSVQV